MKKVVIVALMALLLVGVVFAEDLPTSFSLTGFVKNSDGNSVGAGKTIDLFNINRSEAASTTTFFSLGLYSTAIIGLESHHISMNATNGTHIGRLLLILPAKTGDITEVNNINITLNAFPTLSSIVFNDSTPASFADVTARSTYADLELVAGTVVFQWFVNSVNVFNQTFNSVASSTTLVSVFDASHYGVFDSLKVTVFATDEEYTITRDSAIITVANTLPLVSNVVVAPGSPSTSSDLTVTFSYFDEDSDAQSGSLIRWFKDSVEQIALENLSTVGSVNTAKGQQWNAKVSPRDGRGLGSEVNSNTVTIGNTAPSASALLCDHSSGFEDCGNTEFGDNISAIKVTCADADADIATVSYVLRNLFDAAVIANAVNATLKVGDVFTLTANIPILDSGEWNLTTTCTDTTGISSVVSDAWTIAFGSVNAFMLNANATVINDQNFTFTTRATCTGGECVNIVALLDPQSTSFDISLKKDWNLISLPLTSEGKGIEEMLSSIEGKYSVVAGFDSEGAKVYDPRLRLFSDLTALDPRQGYWVKMNEPATLRVVGEEAAMDTLSLKEGWNLIAVPLSLSQNGLNDVAMSIEPSDAVNSIYRYDASQKQYDVARFVSKEGWGSADNFDALEAGKGYWVRSNQAATISFATIQELANKGLIPENSGNPFYTNSANPRTTGCLVSIKPGDNCDTTWNVLANGTQGESFAFFTNYSTSVNVTTPIAQININAPPGVSGVVITPGVATTSNDLGANFVFVDGDGDANAGTRIQWFKDDVEQTSLENITTVGSGNTSKGQAWKITVTPFDGLELGFSITSATVTIVSTAPTVSAVVFNDSSVQTLEDVSASTTYNDVDADAGTLTFRWFVNSSLAFTDVVNVAAGNSGSSVLDSANYGRLDVVNVTVTGNDGGLDSVVVTAGFIVANTAPSASNVVVAPATPSTIDNLSISFVFTDVDSDGELGSRIRWFRNSVEQTSLENTSIISSSNTLEGQQWNAKVTPRDGISLGPEVTSNTITIANAGPLASSITFNDSSVQTFEDVAASSTYSDVDADAGTLTFRWFVNSSLAFTDVVNVAAGNSGSSVLDSVNYNRADRVNVSVTPNDGDAEGSVVNSVTLTIVNTAPTAADVVVAPPGPLTADALTVTFVYSDVDGDAQSGSRIRWFKDSVEQTALENLSSVAGSNTARGQTWQAKVVPRDSISLGSQEDSNVITILNTAPKLLTPTFNDTTLQTLEDISVSSVYSDADIDIGTVTFRWFVNGGLVFTDIVGGVLDSSVITVPPNLPPSSVLSASNYSKGDIINVSVLATDGSNASKTVNSALLNVVNTAPSATDVAIAPVQPQTDDDLNATFAYSDADSDVESGSLVRWFKDSVEQTALENLTIVDGANTARDEVWFFRVRARDGFTLGSEVQSNSITVGSTAPLVSGPLLNDSSVQTFEDVLASSTYNDIDGDVGTVTFRWFVDDSLVFTDARTSIAAGSVASSVLDSTNFVKGQIVNVSAQANDGGVSGLVANSVSITVENTKPVASNVVVAPLLPSSDDSLNVTFAYSDLDSDVESGSLIRWFKDSVEQTVFENLSEVGSVNTAKGQQWNAKVTSRDGVEFGVEVTSNTITIGGVRSAVTVPTFNDSFPRTFEDVQSNVLYLDPDGDSAFVVFTWKVNDVVVLVTNVTSVASGNSAVSVLDASNFNKTNTIVVSVQSNDGDVPSFVATSATIVVDNTEPVASNVVVAPADAKTADDLTVTFTFTDIDSDVESGSLIRWFKDSVEQNALENLTVVGSSNTAKGQEWGARVTPRDGFDLGIEVLSNTITIGNTDPVAFNATISPNPASATDSLTAVFGFSDVDSDAQSGSLIEWFKDTVEQTVLENVTTVASSNTVKGQRWSFRVTPSDGVSFGNSVNSGNVTIGNVPPLLADLVFNDSSLQTQEVIGALVNYSDADDDIGAITFRWFVDDVNVVNSSVRYLFGGLLVNNISSSFYSRGQAVRVDVTANDGSIDANALSLSTVVVNTAPSMSTPVINNPTPNQLEDVLGQSTYDDVDENAGSVVLTWFVNGTLAKTVVLNGVSNGTTVGLSLEASFTHIGDILKFTAVASDDADSSVLVASSVTVEPACATGQTQACSNQVGVCSGATETCVNGAFNGCSDIDFASHNSSYAVIENNCDGLDNDCDGNADETGTLFCSDGSFCNGNEVCGGVLGCGAGTTVSCTGNDLSLISTCSNNPDNNAFTFDYAAAFTSSCDEGNDVCTSIVQSPTHTCNATACGSVCEDGDTNVTSTLVCQGEDVFRQVDGCSTSCAFTDSVAADVLERECELGCSNGACVDDDHSPIIDTFSPTNLNPTINEGDSIAFSATTSEPDGKSITLRWLVDDVVQVSGTSFTYSTSFTDAGVHTIKLQVSNGRFTTQKTWSVTVTDVAAVDEPDLTVSGLKLFFPVQATVNGLSIYRFTIKNIGVGAANNFLWQLNTGDSLLTAGAPLTLVAGSEVEVYQDLTYTSSGAKTVTVTADHTTVVAEEDETNNAQMIQVTVS